MITTENIFEIINTQRMEELAQEFQINLLSIIKPKRINTKPTQLICRFPYWFADYWEHIRKEFNDILLNLHELNPDYESAQWLLTKYRKNTNWGSVEIQFRLETYNQLYFKCLDLISQLPPEQQKIEYASLPKSELQPFYKYLPKKYCRFL